MPLDFKQRFFRLLPAVDKILREKTLLEVGEKVPRGLIVEAVQDVIAEKRSFIRRAASANELELLDLSSAALAGEAQRKIEEKAGSNLRPVLNATGVVLHTNLGRSPLARAALEAIKAVGASYSNLELSLESGRRSSRYDHVEELLCRLTGAEAALVVNNNAGAVFLALNTLARGKEVIVSRGELVEIGGSFRLPEVMTSSGAALVEVGTTNRSYLKDYREAITENTALLLKVHTSNYKVMGFTAAVRSGSLVGLAREYGIPVMEDLGSGVLIDLSRYGLPYEPRVQDLVATGVDLITFSGDKLLGGPQAGVIIGKKVFIGRIKKNQLTRPLRVDKLTLAALEATLRLYLDENKALQEIPILRMLTLPVETLKTRAKGLAAELDGKVGSFCQVGTSQEKAKVGGGSLPQALLPSCQLTLRYPGISAGKLAERLRQARPPVIVRVKRDMVLIDLRSISEEDDRLLLDTVAGLLQEMDYENNGGMVRK
ncbi:MAG: L-seryl-tRNA(Sec) selenium transferase [Dethiobacteria bacterium]